MVERKTPLAECENCPLLKRVGMGGRGILNGEHADIVIVGEGPGREEAVQKVVFVGPSGRMLMSAFNPHKVKSYWITNASLCFAGDEAEKKESSECCKVRLLAEIAQRTPRLVVTLGNIPTNLLLGVEKSRGITKRRGTKVSATINGFATTVLPTFHPAAILRSSSLGPDFKSDFEEAITFVNGTVSDEAKAVPLPGRVEFTVTSDWRSVLAEAEEGTFAVVDLETSSLDMTKGRILCAVIATHRGIYIIPEEVVERPDFAEAMERSTANWSGHNAKFDRNFFLYRTGRRIKFKFDTLLGHYLFDERQGVHDLKGICRREYRAPDWEGIVTQYSEGKEDFSYADIPRQELYVYAANDGFWQRKLTEDLIAKLLQNAKLTWLMKHLLAPAVNAFSDAETRGILLDTEALRGLVPKYATPMQRLRDELIAIAGREFNPRSTQQTAEIMYDVLGIPKVGNEGRSTGAKTVLKAFAPGDYPFIDALLEFRELNTVLTRYLTGLENSIRDDGRVHPSFNLAGTVTGRLSCSSPNVQNQPKRNSAIAKDIRDLFTADEGKVWAEADFGQCEYRLIALLSQDPYLIKCYQEGRDLHAEAAKDAWGADYTKDDRTLAKGVNFGLLYGRSEGGILRDGTLKIAPEIVHRMAEQFFVRMPKVVEFNEHVKRLVLSQGYVESPLGRRRRFPQLPFVINNRPQLEAIFREAINMLSQSAASDATLYAFVTLHQKGYAPTITVHDSITMMADERDTQDVLREQARIMQDCATELYGDQIPFPVDTGYGRRWGTLTDVK